MKYLTGILIGVAVLLLGLFAVFTFVVKPKSAATVQAGAPKPPPTAQQTAAPNAGVAAIQAAPALVTAIGGAYASIFGGK